MSELEVDLSHAGISEAELLAYAPALRAELEKLDASPEGEFLRVPHQPEIVRQIQRVRRGLPAGLRDVVQLGIGGSSLGAQTLCAALLPARHNERIGRGGLRFHLPDNVDPESFVALRSAPHFGARGVEVGRHARARRAALRAARGLAPRGPREGARSTLRGDDRPRRVTARVRRARADSAARIFVPALCGVPVTRVLAGARALEARCRTDRGLGPAGRLAALHWLHDQKRERRIHVELIYGDALLAAGDWFRQLWAESLGKQGRGATPVVARGTTDQHSQVQLYVDGPDDKFYTVLRSGRSRAKLRIARSAEPALLRGLDLGELFRAEAQGTIEALLERGRPLVELTLPRVDPESLGELLMLQQMQTALAAALYGVYAFDQPGVEAGKLAALRLLSGTRPG